MTRAGSPGGGRDRFFGQRLALERFGGGRHQRRARAEARHRHACILDDAAVDFQRNRHSCDGEIDRLRSRNFA